MARNINDIIRIVSNLIERADGLQDTQPAEAALMRAKAEEWMLKYRIEEEQLIAAEPGSIEPTQLDIEVSSYDSFFKSFHESLWRRVAQHCDLRYAFRWESERRGFTAQAVGYDSDLRYAAFLFQSAKLMMISKLEPEVDPKLSEKENIYRLRSAGIDRQRIAEMVFGQRGHQEGLKVGRLYKEACADRGEEAAVAGRNVNAKTYRIAYANAFVRHFSHRLIEARSAAEATGGALDIHGRMERVDEAFYTRFPMYRPQPQTEEVQVKANPRKGRALKAWTKADEERYIRFNESPAALRAIAAGQTAASQVQITRAPRTGRVDSTPEPSSRELES